MSGKTYLSPAKFRIFAHRGTTELGAVENTLQAFRDAVTCGADYLETDVQVTKDQQVVIFHDEDLKRLLGVRRRVSELSLTELQSFAAAKGMEIPTLADALIALPQARFNIDIKVLEAAQGTVRVIEQFRATERVLVSSFKAVARNMALSKLQGVATSADSSRVIKLLLGLLMRNERKIRSALSGLDAVQIPTRVGPFRLDSQRLIRACHSHGVEVHYWTINNPAEAKRIRALGANGIVTDRCKLMAMELAE